MNSLVLVTTASVLLGWNPAPPPNLERPDVAPRLSVPVTIKTEAIKGEGKNIKAKIIIPRQFVHAPGGAGGAAPPTTGAAPRSGDRGSLPMGTIIAGLALSLAAVSAVFVFRGNRSTKTAALAVLAGAVVLGGLGVAQADLAVPGGNGPRREPKPEIIIELADDGDSVTLILAK
jgi:hypothetical protein